MLSHLIKSPNGALSVTRLALTIGVAVFALIVVLLNVLELMGVDPRPLATTLLLAVTVAVLVAAGIYAMVYAPLRSANEARVRNLASRAAQNERIVSDSLTGLLNRQGITSSLVEAMAHAERYGNPLAIALVDIDELTHVRKQHGRKAGDKLVRSIADLFGETLRLPDRVGRYGGGQFLVVLPQAAPKHAVAIAERVRSSVGKQEFMLGDKVLTSTVSIGVGRFRKSEDLEHLLSRVGQALQEARAAGGNRVASADSSR